MLAKLLLLGEPLGVELEVPSHMRPARPAAFGVQVVIGPPAIRADNPGVFADQGREPLAVAVLCHLEARRALRGRCPQRALLAGGPPASLVGVDRRLCQDMSAQRLVRQLKRQRRTLADRLDRPDRQADPE